MRANSRDHIELAPDDQHGWRASRGQILVMFAAGLLLLVGMVALAVDTGFIMAERRQVQSAADAGAMAAAKAKLDYLAETPGVSESAQVDSGKRYGAANADTGEENVEVDTSPDGYGEEYVEVTVTKDVESFFLRALYDGTWAVSASAVAGHEPDPLPYALVALDCGPHGGSGIDVSGSGTIDVNEGSIMSNCGITRDGDSSVVTAEGAIDAVGEIDEGPQWDAGQGFREDRPPVTDPIDENSIPPPTKTDATSQPAPGGVDVQDIDDMTAAVTSLSNESSNGARCPNDAVCTMQPGYYGGGLTLDVRNEATLDMQPGIYVFGEGFTLRGRGGATIQGDDVMVYIDDDSAGTLFDPDNATIELAAPESSPYAGGLDGMALWIANCSEFRKKASNSGVIDGVIYAPCSTVELSGSPGAQGMQVIVGNLELSGGGDFDILFEDFVEIEVPHIFLVQ